MHSLHSHSQTLERTIEVDPNRSDTLHPHHINSNRPSSSQSDISITHRGSNQSKILFQSDQCMSLPANYKNQTQSFKSHSIGQSGRAKHKRPLIRQNRKYNRNFFTKNRKSTISVPLKKSANSKGQGEIEGREKSKSSADVRDSGTYGSELYISKKSFAGSRNNSLTKSCQDLTKLEFNANVQNEPNVCDHTKKDSKEDCSESPLLDKISDVAICNEILVKDKPKLLKPYRNVHNSHLYTFDNPSLLDLNDWDGKDSDERSHSAVSRQNTVGGHWKEQNGRVPSGKSTQRDSRHKDTCLNDDVSLPSSPCDTQYLLTTFLNTEPESEIQHKLRNPMHVPPCTPKTSSASLNSKDIIRLRSVRTAFRTQARVKLQLPDSYKIDKFDVIIQHNGVLNGDGNGRKVEPKSQEFSDFYRDSNVYSSQSQVPSQYVLLQSAKLRYYETYIQSMRPKTPKRHKWYGSPSFGQERCPCCTPVLRPRNAPIRLQDRCASPFCCQNLRLPNPKSRRVPFTPEHWTNSTKSDDFYVPKRLSKSASISKERNILSLSNGNGNNERLKNKKDYIVKRGRIFEPLEVRSLDVEDIFEVNNDFQKRLNKGQTIVHCQGQRSSSTEVKVNVTPISVRPVSTGARSPSAMSKTVRFQDGYEFNEPEKSIIYNNETTQKSSPRGQRENGNSKLNEVRHDKSDGNEIESNKDETIYVRNEMLDKGVRKHEAEKRKDGCNIKYECNLGEDDPCLGDQSSIKDREVVLQSEDSFLRLTSEIKSPQTSSNNNSDADNATSDDSGTTPPQEETKGKFTKEDSVESTESSENSSNRGPQTDMRQFLDLKPCVTRRKYSSESIPSIIISDEEGNEAEVELDHLDDDVDDDSEEVEKSEETHQDDDVQFKVNRRPKTGRQRSGVRSQIKWQEIKDDSTVTDDQKLVVPDLESHEGQKVKKKVKKVKTEVHPQAYRKNNKSRITLKNVNYYCSPEFLKMKLKKKVARKMKGMGVIQEQSSNVDKSSQMAAPKIVVTRDMSDGSGSCSGEEEEVTEPLNEGMLAVPENTLVTGNQNICEEQN